MSEGQPARALSPAIKHERRLILALCFVAGLRVFLFSTAFPFFTNVDEIQHFDTVCRYATGHVPRGVVSLGDEAGMMEAVYSSPEFLVRLDDPSLPIHQPVWTLPPAVMAAYVRREVAHWKHALNNEATEPPVYYDVAACWYRFGKMIGLTGGNLLYWLRAMNSIVYALLVWVAYAFVRRFYGKNPFLLFGVPLLLVGFPQDCFYSVNNDVLSPVFFGLSLYCLLEIHLHGPKRTAFYLITGLLIAAALLTKFTNAALLPILVLVFLLKVIRRGGHAAALRAELPRLVLMLLAAGLPIGLWLLRNHIVLGDVTGSGAKLAIFGWTPKPLSQVWRHPIFTPRGFGFFWSQLMARFWRGEITWAEKAMASRAADLFYVISSGVFLVGAAVAIRKSCAEERFADRVALLTVILSVALLAAFSVAYDFGGCFYPSRVCPYLTSGRLIAGVIIPFLVLYLRGMDFVLSKVGLARMRWVFVFGTLALMIGSEIVVSMPAFRSAYNWFHMGL